jgi:Domain of unknown function (DUF1816)
MKLRQLVSKEASELGWWVEIATTTPRCTYYFGPFECESSAHTAQIGYIEDLENEGAQGIAVRVQECQPQQLTIDPESSIENLSSLTWRGSVFSRFRL